MGIRSCACCGKVIYKSDICNECWKKWKNLDGSLPLWLKELIKIQSSFERKVFNEREIAFSDDERDMYGNKIVRGDGDGIAHKYNPNG